MYIKHHKQKDIVIIPKHNNENENIKMYNIKNHKTKDIVIIPKHNENNKNIKKNDIKTNDKSYESIKNIVLEKSKK